MDDTDKAKLKEILLNPQDFISRIDTDDWVVFKKREDVRGFTDQEIIDSDSFYLNYSIDFIVDILNELKIELLYME